jgi:hypothetical protein
MTGTPWKSLPLHERLRAAHDWWQATISPMPNDSDAVLEAAAEITRLTARVETAERERDEARATLESLVDAAENAVIAFGVGWDMDGVIDVLRERLRALTPREGGGDE